jgi:REP element-mobilizing transposase RayT
MTRLRRIETVNRIFSITFNLERSAASLEPTERSIVLNTLRDLRRPNNFALYGYVIMPTHAHLLIHPKSVPLPTIMRLLKSLTAAALERTRPLDDPLWQRSYHDFICRRARDFSNKLAYIHQNPKAAGLVQNPAHWPWSSCLYYEQKLDLPVRPDAIDFNGDPNEPLWPAPWRRL